MFELANIISDSEELAAPGVRPSTPETVQLEGSLLSRAGSVSSKDRPPPLAPSPSESVISQPRLIAVSYTHLTLPTTPYV